MGEGPEPPYYWDKTWEAEADDFLRQASELEETARDAPDDIDAHHEAQELIWRAFGKLAMITVYADSPEACVALGRCLTSWIALPRSLQQPLATLAIACFDLAEKRGGDPVGFAKGRGDAYRLAFDDIHAAISYEQYLEASPEDADAWYQLGYCYSRMGRPAKAEEALDRAVQADPRDTRALGLTVRTLLNLGFEQMKSGPGPSFGVAGDAFDKAIRLATRLAELEPQLWRTWETLADAFEEWAMARAGYRLHLIAADSGFSPEMREKLERALECHRRALESPDIDEMTREWICEKMELDLAKLRRYGEAEKIRQRLEALHGEAMRKHREQSEGSGT